MDGELGVSRCKLLHVELVNNEVLPYSTGNYIQSLVIEHDGREKECTYMSDWVTLLDTEIDTTTLSINYNEKV